MVGDILRLERERQKLSVKDIEHGTSIRTLYIEAIENGEYDKLPGAVYTKGFIRNYGNFLNLDGDSLSRQFSEETAPPPPPPLSTNSNSPKSVSKSISIDGTEKIINEPIPKMEEQKTFNIENSGSTPTPPPLVRKNNNSGLLVAAVILIAAVVGGLWYYFTNIEGKEIAQNPPIQTATNTPDTSDDLTSTNTTSATPTAAASVPGSGVNLQAKFNDKCWTRVIVDGRVAYEGTAESGQILSWQGKDRIAVTLGDAGAVELIENGNSLGIAGAVGDVVEKTFIRK